MLSIPMLPFPLLQEAVQRTWAELTNCDIILRHPKKAKTYIEEPLKAFCMRYLYLMYVEYMYRIYHIQKYMCIQYTSIQ